MTLRQFIQDGMPFTISPRRCQAMNQQNRLSFTLLRIIYITKPPAILRLFLGSQQFFDCRQKENQTIDAINCTCRHSRYSNSFKKLFSILFHIIRSFLSSTIIICHVPDIYKTLSSPCHISLRFISCTLLRPGERCTSAYYTPEKVWIFS